MRFLLIALVALGFVACSQQRATELPLPPTDPSRLSHPQHAQIACGACHRPQKRPGADEHRPCDDAACHAKEFLAQPGKLCQVCHTKVTATPLERDGGGLEAPLKPYPLEDPWQTLPSKFSHRRHLDSGLMESRVGFHVACVDCHVRDGMKAPPDHATCSRCHAPEANLPKAPKMTECAACHQTGSRERNRARLIKDDLHFDHARHKTDRKGRAIRCEQCHSETSRSNSYTDHAPPKVQQCVTCHDDSDRTPGDMRMRVCETCHAARQNQLTTIAPRSHLPATERPLDHTLAFRRDHAEIAERDATRCATCHVRMSGNPRQACDECHQTMQPADHRITFRELDHGAEAAGDRDRCARCHVVEFCTACHQQRPRSHGIIGAFQTEHGRLARINIRSCTTCHTERSCADCHDVTPRMRR